MVLAFMVVFFAVMWPLSLVGHLVGLTPNLPQLLHHNHEWEHAHYPLILLRYVGALFVVVAILSGPLWLMIRDADERTRARAVEAQRRADAEQAAAERELREWLNAPPPPLLFPGRFTDKWFAAHVPGLHPGQVPVLIAELHARGWTDEGIRSRVWPYLATNEYLADASMQAAS